jgi:hypothetical protein
LNTILPAAPNCGDSLIVTASGKAIRGSARSGNSAGTSIDLVFASNGLAANVSSTMNYSCSRYSISGHTTTGMSPASAQGTVSIVPGTLSDSGAYLNSSTANVNVKGDFDFMCPFATNPLGGGGQ